jgi:hypothetical protein
MSSGAKDMSFVSQDVSSVAQDVSIVMKNASFGVFSRSSLAEHDRPRSGQPLSGRSGLNGIRRCLSPVDQRCCDSYLTNTDQNVAG